MIVFIVNYGKREYRTMKTEKVRAFKWKDFCGGHENFNVQFPTRNVYVAICRNKKNTNISLSLSLSFSFFLFFSLSLSLFKKPNQSSSKRSVTSERDQL